jgi:hypothetical protein
LQDTTAKCSLQAANWCATAAEESTWCMYDQQLAEYNCRAQPESRKLLRIYCNKSKVIVYD